MEADGALDAEVTTSEARPVSATPTAGAGFIAKIERTLRAPLLWAALVAILLILQLCLVVLHDPWLDEWQALQIALQSPDFAALLENLRYEGHPPLWYLLLIAAGSILHPVWILPAVQAIVATTFQLLILLRAPFARWQRLLIATGFFALFEYGVLARSLGLGVLLLTAALAFRRRRWSWVMIALLPLTDFLFGVLSIICIAIQARERRLWWPGLLLWCAAGTLAALVVRPAPDVVPALHLQSPGIDLAIFVRNLSPLLIPLQTANGHLQWNSPLPTFIAPLAGLAFLAFCWLQLRQRPFDAAACSSS